MVVESGMVASEGGGLLLWAGTVKGVLKTMETICVMVWQLLLWEEVEEKRPSEIVPTFWNADEKERRPGRNSVIVSKQPRSLEEMQANTLMLPLCDHCGRDGVIFNGFLEGFFSARQGHPEAVVLCGRERAAVASGIF